MKGVHVVVNEHRLFLIGLLGLLGAACQPVTMGTSDSTAFDSSAPQGPVANHGVRIYCPVSHFSHDDPIVFPGQHAAAHLHMFWGNTLTHSNSTGFHLLESGNSTCEGGIANRSAYWAPAMFNEEDEVVLPESIFVYYKSFGANETFDRSTIMPIPNGLEMLASLDVPGAGPWNFRIGPAERDGTPGVQSSIRFPVCVAVDASGAPILSSADNVSHLSYGSAGPAPNHCPGSHPYRIPQVSYELFHAVDPASDWYLASDPEGGEQGATLHADYIAAWDPATMDALVECNRVARTNCGFDGGRGQLPERFLGYDGTVVYLDSTTLAPSVDRTPFGTSLQPMAAGGH